jgi:hypothetical protein
MLWDLQERRGVVIEVAEGSEELGDCTWHGFQGSLTMTNRVHICIQQLIDMEALYCDIRFKILAYTLEDNVRMILRSLEKFMSPE